MKIATLNEHPFANPYLNELDRPIYGVCRLMRQLADDITNVGPLTRDQSQMAAAVAVYADMTHDTLMDGLAELGKLMADSQSEREVDVPKIGRLIRHLSLEAQFMQEAAGDYRGASLEPWR